MQHLKFNPTTEQYETYRYRVVIISRGTTMEKFDDSDKYWVDFTRKWYHTTIKSITTLSLSDAEQARLDEVNGVTELIDIAKEDPWRHLSTVCDYVAFGAIDPDTTVPYFQDQVTVDTTDALCDKYRHDKALTLADIRFDYETSGVTLDDGTTILTDREFQAQLTSAYMALKEGLRDSVDWKAPSGWTTVTLEEIKPVATASATHVQPAFTAERRVSEAMAALTDPEAVQSFDLETAFQDEITAIKEAETTTA